jgi:hypothetical protein
VIEKIVEQWVAGAPTIGTDAECFFERDGQVIPADNLLPPEEAALDVAGVPGAVFFDGIQAELRSSSNGCRAFVLDNVRHAMQKLDQVGRTAEAILDFSGAREITADILAMVRDPRATRFGCEPHQSARLGGGVDRIKVKLEEQLITYAGAHIHLGSSWIRTAEKRLRVARVADVIMNLPLVMIEDPVSDALRRQVYGKAGCYRDKPYGVELRTPSSQLLKHPALLSFAMGLARLAHDAVASDVDDMVLQLVDLEAVIHAIDTIDKKTAAEQWPRIRELLAEVTLQKSWGGGYGSDFSPECLDAFEELADRDVVQQLTYEDVRKAWRMDAGGLSYHGSHAPGWSSGYRELLGHREVALAAASR